MAKGKKEQLVQIIARIPVSLKRKLMEAKPSGVTMQGIFTAALKLWVALPKDARWRILDAETVGSKKDEQQALVEVMTQIAETAVEKALKKKR